MKFHIITFGCQMNASDSDWIAEALILNGMTHTTTEKNADIVLLNTCSVREKPEHKVYSLLGRLQKTLLAKNPNIIVGVGGCVAQQLGTQIFRRFPFVRLIFGTDSIANVPQSVERLIENSDLRISLLDFLDYYSERLQINEPLKKPTAFVNIMQGCNNFCAYCIVPFTRGRQKSRSKEFIIEECKSLVKRGAKDITLLGQNVNSYGHDLGITKTSFTELLEEVSKITGILRLKFMTPHPKDLAPELISAFKDLPNLSPQLHLPLQSGSNNILKAMGRKYTREKYLEIIESIHKTRLDIAITTDLIVGFPGETEQDFNDTLDIMKQSKFETSFSFKYSNRPGTKAATMPFQVPESIKSERLKILQDTQEVFTQLAFENQVGKIAHVLVESELINKSVQNIIYQGRDDYGHRVSFESSVQDLIGKEIKLNIVKAKRQLLVGQLL